MRDDWGRTRETRVVRNPTTAQLLQVRARWASNWPSLHCRRKIPPPTSNAAYRCSTWGLRVADTAAWMDTSLGQRCVCVWGGGGWGRERIAHCIKRLLFLCEPDRWGGDPGGTRGCEARVLLSRS